MKNCLFSGRVISNLVRLVITSSTSTFEKSGLIVTSRFNPVPIAILRSPPKENKLSFLISPKSFEFRAFIYGIKYKGVLFFFKGSSKIISPKNPICVGNRPWTTLVQILLSLL